MQTATVIRASVVLAAALGVSSCKKKQGEGGTHGAVTLGVYASMTGDKSAFGIATRNGIQLALDEMNAHGGLMGQPVRMVVEDTRGDSSEAASAVTRLIQRENVTGVLGEVASSLSLAGGRIADRAHVPMITPSSTGEAVTQIGPYVFRVCFTDNFQGAVMAHFAHDELHLTNVAILKDQGSAYSIGLAQAFRDTFTRLGGTISDEQAYRAGDSHFSAQLGSILGNHPGGIFVPGYYSEVGLIGREARGLNFTGPMMGGDGWDSPTTYQNDDDKLVGSYFSEGYAPDHPVTPRGTAFAAAYEARYHEHPNGLAALAYDAALVMGDSIRRAGSTDGDAIRRAIGQTANFEGATGNITIDANRNAQKGAVVLRVEANAIAFHRAFTADELH